MTLYGIKQKILPMKIWSVERLGLYRQDAREEKFFKEPIENSNYDIRYYQEKLKPAAVRSSLVKLLTAFSQLCSRHGLEFFLVHGSLLGWFWGRQILPWDDDIDVSVSLEVLEQLEKLQGCCDHGKSFLEINPHCSERRTSNRTPADHREPNKIDARYIDCETGLFLDITALTQKGSLLASKCPHVYRYNEIYPLQRDFFEGVAVNIPARSERLLKREYSSHCITETKFNGYEWNPETKSWQQGKLHRVCRKLIASINKRELSQQYIIQTRYRRTVACYPTGKRLYAVEDNEAEPISFGTDPGDLSREVVFFKLQGQSDNRRYWAKLYQAEAYEQLVLECLLYEVLSQTDFPFVQPVGYDRRFGILFHYDDELFHGVAVHAYHSGEFFSHSEVQLIEEFAGHRVNHPVLGRQKMSDLTDFQTVRTSQGLKFIDFTLWPEYW